MRRHYGFTLIEVSITVGIFLIIAVVSIPLYFKFQEFSERESVKQEILQSIREIQLQAVLGQDNNNHGIYFSGHNYTTYTGLTFATKVAGSDQSYEISNIISASANTDINFLKNAGTPTQATSLLLRNDRSAMDTNISINALGLIE
ncbi:MAG: hypothetical protein UT32_C0001G0016 [Parcubacteria group bacterium GW2011_GWC2_39_14]|nr:MAG: hypothetical protein UT32_C0001G0016 [Parcubacteria group bacterium GW2011_GWC2_39_14]KKR55440.1 MAG: hypothetical protein UT91_C0001G0015 [Parcubacteria group bacterium GW2011_GWA2_40_23]